MPVPDYQSLMLPFLKLAGDRKEHSLRKVIEALAAQYGLTEAERSELLPSGRQATFDNRVGVDGATLAQLMIDNSIGVTSVATYELKRADSDYFAEE